MARLRIIILAALALALCVGTVFLWPVLFEKAASMTPRRPPAARDEQMGAARAAERERIARGDGGRGLISSDGRPYRPTLRLDCVAMDIARLVAADRYQPRVAIASELPPDRLSGVDDQLLTQTMKSVVAGARIGGELRAIASTDYRDQHLDILLVETSDESAAGALLKLAQAKSAAVSDSAMLGVAHGRLFCLVVERCARQGGKAFETRESIQRFAPGIEAILKNWQQTAGTP